MPAFMIAQIKVKNQDLFQEYLEKTAALAGPMGAEMLVRGPVGGRVLGAEPDHDVAVVVRFHQGEDIDALYAAPAYQELVELRDRAADMTITRYDEAQG